MASRLLSSRVMYLPNISAAVKHFRAFSWTGGSTDGYRTVGETENESLTVWPDEKLGPFGPQDSRFPLPGKVGTSLKPAMPSLNQASPTQRIDPQAIFDQLPSERYRNILQQAQEEAEFLADMNIGSDSAAKSTPSPDDMLECVAHDCPQIMRKDFADLFPWMNIMHGHFTIITISQKTKEDMTGWSESVEAEREKLLESFVQGASDICDALHKAGYWADFIDPSCGKPYLGQHTNASLYETDERYRKLGFEIDDLGCCKVIRHHIWGTHAYIGCLFTNAPPTDPILQMMKKT